MPVKDGFQAAKEILAIIKKSGSNIKVYGCSAGRMFKLDDDEETLEETIDVGMTSLIKKPF